MSIEQKGPGGVSTSFGQRKTSKVFDLNSQYDTRVYSKDRYTLVGPNGELLGGGAFVFFPPSGDVTGKTDTEALKKAVAECANTSKSVGFIEGDYYFNDTIHVTDGYRSYFEAAKNGNDPNNGKIVVPPKFVGAGLLRTRVHMTVASKPLLWFYGREVDGFPQMQSPYLEGIGFFGPGFDAGDNMTVAVQFGGESANLKQITADPWFIQCGFYDWHTCVRHDDTTAATYTKCFFQRFKFGVDRGYNSDIYVFNQCAFGDQGLTSLIQATTTNGSTAITTTGGKFANLTSGAYIAGVGIPTGTTVTKVNDNAATLSQNATASGTVEIYTFLGVAVSDTLAGYGSKWVAPFGIMGNSNGVQFNNCWFMRLYSALSAYQPSSSASVFNTCYSELLYKLVELGNKDDTGAPFGLVIENHHFSQPQSFRDRGVIDVMSAGGTVNFSVHIVNSRTDSTTDADLPAVPWVYTPNSYNSSATIEWDQNILPTRSGVASVNHGGTQAFIPDKQRFIVSPGSHGGGYVRTYGVASDLFWDYAGEDQVHITVNGNMTVNNFGGQNPPKGRKIVFILTDSGAGARTVTFGTKYRKTDGTALGAFAASTASKTAVLEFIWDGSNMRQLNTAQWA